MRRFSFAIYVLLVAAFAVWLFYNENFAEPGSLIWAHRESAECADCHRAWKGTDNEMCLQCHDFWDVSLLKPQIRFHESKTKCLSCHTEHRGADANISEMNHGLLNENLNCTQCHIDPHSGLFGEECRQCHRIKTWRIQGYRHPSEDSECNRCHKAPLSHRLSSFWERVAGGEYEVIRDVESSLRENCGRCHIPHRWDHLRMKHGPETDDSG